MRQRFIVGVMFGLLVSVAACEPNRDSENAAVATTGSAKLAGQVRVEGSSTLLPVSTAMADAFRKLHTDVRITVSESGTGGGFKKFCAGDVDIAGASRPINAAEIEQCASAKVELIELPIAFDSLTVVVNPADSFASWLTVRELRTLWQPQAEGNILKWNQVRASVPDQPIALLGPGSASGTFDYFTLAIVGTQSSSRKDYKASEDDTVLVDG